MLQDTNYAIYEITKKVYDNKILRSQGADILFSKYGINKNSFENYIIPTYKCMLNGAIVKGAISIPLRKVFLENIVKDFGEEGLRFALQSYLQTIEYYENKGQNKPGDRALYNEYLRLLDDKVQSISVELDEADDIGVVEGLRKEVYVNAYERNPKARRDAIKYHGTNCLVCGMSFEKMYGELGKGFIHIHHIVPISEIGQEYKVNYKTDLIPVCPNCHAMLHRNFNGKTLTIEELKNIINKTKSY